MNPRPILAGAVFLGAIVAANYAVSHFGMVPVGLGLLAPAGVYFAGVTFVARDSVQDGLGRGTTRARLVTLALILAGAGLSAFLSPKLAVASGAAFIISELLDMVVYEPLRDGGYVRAALASNLVGSVADSLVFLSLAGFPLTLTSGQVAGKMWITGAVVLAVLLVRAVRRSRPVTA